MEEMPEDILLTLFDFLSQKELQVAAKVCERWRSVISTSSSLLNNITTSISSSSIKNLEKNLPLCNLDIDGSYKDENYQIKVKKLVENEENSIESIKFSLPSTSFVSEILENLENLTNLSIVGVKNSSNEDFPVDLPNLKSLIISEPSAYLKLLRCPQIEKLSIKDSELEPLRLSRATNNFLKKCKKLKFFSFSGIFPSLDVQKFSFQLESFSLSLVCSPSSEICVVEFLQKQKFIKKLKLGGFLTREIIRVAINEMKVSEISVDLNKIFGNFKELKINSTIKSFEISKLPNDLENVAKLIAHCSKVENLKISPLISTNFDEICLKLSNSCENLKTLFLNSIQNPPQDEMNFEKVETLIVNQINSDDEVVSFVEFSFGCMKVKNIKINNWGVCGRATPTFNTEDLKAFLTDLEFLEILQISGKFKITREFFETIKETETSLKLIFLDVRVDDENFEKIDEIVRILDGTSVRVVIPDLVQCRREIWERNFDENEEENSSFEENSCESECDKETEEEEEEEFDESDEDSKCLNCHFHEFCDSEEQEESDEDSDDTKDLSGDSQDLVNFQNDVEVPKNSKNEESHTKASENISNEILKDEKSQNESQSSPKEIENLQKIPKKRRFLIQIIDVESEKSEMDFDEKIDGGESLSKKPKIEN